MTKQDVFLRIKEIEDGENECSSAYSLEIDLYVDVLKAIAEGVPEAQSLARLAISTQKLDIGRYCL